MQRVHFQIRVGVFNCQLSLSLILWQKEQIEMWFIVVCTLIENGTRHYFFPKHFFRPVSACSASMQRFLKGKYDA